MGGERREKGREERGMKSICVAPFHHVLFVCVPQLGSGSGVYDVGQRASSRRSRVFYEELFVTLEWPRPDGPQRFETTQINPARRTGA